VLSVAEVAERLSVSDQHVLDLIDEGKLHALDVSGESVSGRRALRIPVKWYEDFVRSRAI
jgi:excisionase family DNA binding protein